MKNEIQNYTESIFENIKHVDEDGNEYWYARELQKVLEYKEIIEKSKITCSNSKYKVSDNFADVGKIVKTGIATKTIDDYKLSRYACYLIVQNGDSRKEVIALGQTYFVIQTRKQELLENLSEDEKRIIIRNKVKKGNLGLNKTAINSGVKNLAEFHNAGYKGLYNGETANDIFKKNLNYREDILDNMGSVELTNNLFRIIQTDDKLKRDKVDNEYAANNTHYMVGKEVRKTIERLGGTMPEELPIPKSNIKELDKKSN